MRITIKRFDGDPVKDHEQYLKEINELYDLIEKDLGKFEWHWPKEQQVTFQDRVKQGIETTRSRFKVEVKEARPIRKLLKDYGQLTLIIEIIDDVETLIGYVG